MSVSGRGVAGDERRFSDLHVFVGDLSIDETKITATAAELNILDGVTATAAELNYLDITAAGTSQASKALVLDSSEELDWAVSSAVVGNIEPLNFDVTLTGVGATGGRAKFTLTTAAALGGWANALKAQTTFSAGGSVSGLGSAFVAEMVAGSGMSAGSYAPLEVELGMPSGALTGTRMSFISLNLYGDDAGTMDDNGYLFDLNGVTAGAGDLFASNAKTGIGMTHTLKCQILGTTYFIALHTSANFGGS